VSPDSRILMRFGGRSEVEIIELSPNNGYATRAPRVIPQSAPRTAHDAKAEIHALRGIPAPAGKLDSRFRGNDNRRSIYSWVKHL
jgi:hypothetical protein